MPPPFLLGNPLHPAAPASAAMLSLSNDPARADGATIGQNNRRMWVSYRARTGRTAGRPPPRGHRVTYVAVEAGTQLAIRFSFLAKIDCPCPPPPFLLPFRLGDICTFSYFDRLSVANITGEKTVGNVWVSTMGIWIIRLSKEGVVRTTTD